MEEDDLQDIPEISASEAQSMGLQEVPDQQANADEGTPASRTQNGNVPTQTGDEDIPTISPEEAKRLNLKPAIESSGPGAYARGFAEGVGPLAASLPAAGAGAEIGAGIGTAIAPGVGTAVGGFVGGLAGGFYGAYKGSELQDWLLDKMGLREGEGFFSRSQQQADIEQHPYAREAGSLTSNLLAFRAGAATGVQRLTGAGAFGAIEAGQEAYNEGKFDPTKIAMATATGFVAPNPRGYAENAMNMGARAVRAFRPGRPDTAAPTKAADDQAVNQNDITTTAKGVAQENSPAPEVDPNLIGDAHNKVTRDSGNDGKYAKDTTNAEAVQLEQQNIAGLAPDQMQALQASLNNNSPAAQARPPDVSKVPAREQPPGDLGLNPEPVPERAQPSPTGEPQAPYDLGISPQVYEQPASQQVYPHPDPQFQDVTISRGSSTPHLAVTADGRNVRVDERVPPVINVGDRTLDPALPLAIKAVKAKEAVDTIKTAVARGEIPKPNDAELHTASVRAGEQASKKWLTDNGFDYLKYTQEIQNIRESRIPPNVAADVERLRAQRAQQARGEEPAPRGEADFGDAAIAQAQRQPAKDVTATVTKPAEKPVARQVPEPAQPGGKLIQNTLDRLRAAGREEVAKQLEAMPHGPEKIDAAAKLNAALANKGGGVKNAARPIQAPRIRNPEVKAELEIDDLGVTAKTKADAERKTRAIEAIKGNNEGKTGAFADHPPKGEENNGALRDRLKRALDQATKDNGGADPVKAYKPTDAPREWYWLHDAREVLRGKRSLDQFRADEKLLRGSDEDFKAFKAERLAANNQKFNKRTGDVVVQKAQAEQAKSFDEAAALAAKETGSESPRVDADEPGLPAREIEIAKARDETVTEQERMLERMSVKFDTKVNVDNLPKQPAKLEGQRFETEAEQRRAKMEAQRQARLAKQGKKPTPEIAPIAKKAAAEAQKKAEGKGKDESEIPAPSKSTLGEFFNDEKGSVDVRKVGQTYRAMQKPLRSALEKYFGMPLSDVSRKFSNVLAQNISRKNQLEASLQRLLDARWESWKSVPKDEVWNYLKALETADAHQRPVIMAELTKRKIPVEKANWMADEAPVHRDLLDQTFKNDEAHGSKQEYIENYVPHIFDNTKVNGLSAEEWMQQRIQSLGATWYQKSRVFQLLEEAEKAGFKLKYDNPIDLIHARMAASINSNILVDTLRSLQKFGMAYPIKEAPKGAKDNWRAKFNLPDGQQWIIHPEGEHLWNNALVARGLSQANNAWGNIYRGWMKLKNVWAPLELMASAFHEVHIVANINIAQNLTRAIKLTQHDPANALKYFGNAVKWSVADPLFALPLDKLGFDPGQKFSKFLGREMQNWWEIPRDQMNARQRMWTDLFAEAGVSPSQAAEEVIGAKRELARAIAKGDYFGATVPALRRGIEISQAWMFKYQIPALKNVAVMRDIEAAIQRDPSLATNHVKRMAVLREIGKNVDSRFGEMFYKNMFWNRYLKDTGIGAFLSLSWNYGQFNQAAGAVNNARIALQDALGKATSGPGAKLSPLQRDIYNASDRATFVTTYVGVSMAASGLLTYALTGQMPEGLDWFFPRAAYKLADGRPARMSTPFNTREPFMLAGHMDESGGGLGGFIGGLGHFLYNKMIISPLVEAWTNRDFFGNKLFDKDAPFYKAALQLIDSTLGNHLDPIGHTSAKRAEDQGGGTLGKALAYAGFGPAPKYISNTSMQNKINSHFNEEGTSYSHPYEYGQKTGLGHGMVQDALRGQGAAGSALKAAGIATDDKLKREARIEHRAALNRATQTSDPEAARQARVGMTVEGGMSKRTAARIRPEEEFQWKYSRLPLETKLSLAKEMSPDEYKFYVYSKLVSKKDRAEIVRRVPTQLPQQAVNSAELPSR